MVIVDQDTLGKWQMAAIPIIGIMLEVGDAIAADACENGLRDGCLARAGPAGNTDEHRLHKAIIQQDIETVIFGAG